LWAQRKIGKERETKPEITITDEAPSQQSAEFALKWTRNSQQRMQRSAWTSRHDDVGFLGDFGGASVWWFCTDE